MPWQETCALEEKARFVTAYERGEHSMAELCRQFEVSRKTGYQVLARWRANGLAGLEEHSRAPRHCPHALTAGMREAVLDMKRAHPTWGPKKIKARLARLDRGARWPAASSIGDLLSREGLTQRRRRRRRSPARTAPFATCGAPNDVWCADFKGWFLTGEGARCEPLTISDAFARYLIRLTIVEGRDVETIWPIFDAAFREFGLPKAVRTDNGAPFASVAAGGLSPLAVRLVKAGVVPERIAPGRPAQNGRHERVHLTLAEDTASPPAASLAAQARRFRSFRRVYNEERPHEALGFAVPADVYVPSSRRFSGRLVSPEYPARVAVRRVRMNGEIRWRGATVYVSETLAGEPVGIAESEDGGFAVAYGPVLLGVIDAEGGWRRPAAAPPPEERSEKSVTHVAGQKCYP